MKLIESLENFMIHDADLIEDFIQRRFPSEDKWRDGNCYYFAKILETRFPGGQIMYEPLKGHFLYKYNDRFYDWGGLYTEDTSQVYDHHEEEGSGFYNELKRATYEQMLL